MSAVQDPPTDLQAPPVTAPGGGPATVPQDADAPAVPPVLLVRTAGMYAEERRYVFDVVLSEWLGLAYELEFDDRRSVSIRVAGDPANRELTLPDGLFATDTGAWLTQSSMPTLPLAGVALDTVRDADGPARRHGPRGQVPVLFGRPGSSGSPLVRTGDGLELSVDVFGGVFFLLTRYEEVANPVHDRHGRFPAGASLCDRAGFLERPLADEYVDLLWTAIHTLWPALARRPAAFRLRLTHDIDRPWTAVGQTIGSAARSVVGDVFHRRNATLAARRVLAIVDARHDRVDRDPLDTFDFLMGVSERHGLTSTFYVMAGNVPGDPDFRYRLSGPRFTDLLRHIHQRGHEVGLHGSYASFKSGERMRMELDALRAACRAAGFEQPAWGVRQHFLRFDNPLTWRCQASTGFAHDSTLGFAERIGFRAGTCREYPVFDLVERRRLGIRERPLLVMDATLLEYMHLGADEAAAKARGIVDVCRRHGGEAVVLYHNSTLPEPRMRRHYRELVEALSGS